mgnify:CR=1 FL=1
MSDAQIARELNSIRQWPYGAARTAAAEEITRRIEADGPRGRLPEALLDLVEAYVFTDQGAKSFVSFARLLRLWDEAPELFDRSDSHNLFWEFKWVAADLADYPQIGREQAAAFLADMGRRYDLAGNGRAAVAMSEFVWAWHSGAPDAEAARQRWLATGSDEFQDCAACFTGLQVSYLTEAGRFEEAIRLGEARQGSCNREPTGTLHSLALSYLNQGRASDAVGTYQAALATLDLSTGDFASARGQAFELLARGGQLARALRDLREDYPHLLTHAATELARLRFLLGVLAGLSANLDVAEHPVGLGQPELATLGALHAWVRHEATQLADRFDARNGTAYYRQRLSQALVARPAPVPLEFGAPVMELSPTGSDEPEPTTLPPDQALATAEQLAGSGDHADAARAYAELAARAESAGELANSGLMLAEAARCLELAGVEEAAHDRYARAVSRLLAGGGEAALIARVLIAWAPVAARMEQAVVVVDRVDELLARPSAPQPVELSEELAARHQQEQSALAADLADVWARTVASLRPEQQAAGRELADAVRAAHQAGERYAGLGRIADAAHSFWLAGKLQRLTGDTEGAVWALESAVEGFTAAGQRKRRIQVASDLIELLRATGQDAKAEELLASLT